MIVYKIYKDVFETKTFRSMSSDELNAEISKQLDKGGEMCQECIEVYKDKKEAINSFTSKEPVAESIGNGYIKFEEYVLTQEDDEDDFEFEILNDIVADYFEYAYCVRDKETGTVIDEFDTVDECKMFIEESEEEDKEEGTYKEDFYEIYDQKNKEIIVGFDVKLKNIRNTKGLTLTETADKLGVPRSTFVKWERGERTPAMYVQIDILNRLAEL